MATVTSVELYLKRIDPSAPFYDMVVEVRDHSVAYTTDPDATDLLGTSEPVNISTFTLNVWEWITFTFATPVEISGEGFFGFVIRSDPQDSLIGVRIHLAAANWGSVLTVGRPYRKPYAGGWAGTFAYVIKIHITGADDFIKDDLHPIGNYNTLFENDYGARLYYDIIIAPTLEAPTDEGTNYYLNKDWLLEMRWADTEGVPIADHTLYFAATGDPEFIPRTDRTRYSIVAYKMFLDVELDYSTTYLWFVRKDLGGGDFVDSETWSFTTMAFTPPTYSTRTRPPYGGGADITVPTGENNMITVERLIAIAQNKFYYEDV